MKKENLISGAIIVIFGIYVYWTSTSFGLKGLSSDPLGPSFFPKMLGLGMAGLGLILIGASFRKGVKDKDTDKENDEATIQKESFFSNGNKRIFLIIGLGIFYVLALLKIGFLIVTLIFIIAIMFITGEKLWWKIILSSFSISIGLFLLFKYLLKVMLPLGFGL